ncbi:hypothetical protein IV102_05255 [bacterium]|nr:hypothetical protein [bacterium]
MNRTLDNTVADSPEGVAFLTALLVRYREIGSARLYQAGHHLRLDFYLYRQLQDDEWTRFLDRLTLSWKVYFGLQRLKPETHEAFRGQAPYKDMPFLADEDGWVEVSTLTVVRDLPSVTLEEFSLVVALINEFFDDALALNEEAPHEDPDQQDEVIHRCLERVRAIPGEAILTGFRDDMRVLIYSSQEDY